MDIDMQPGVGFPDIYMCLGGEAVASVFWVVARVFWVVARRLLGCSGLLLWC